MKDHNMTSTIWSYALGVLLVIVATGCSFQNTQPRTVDAAKAKFDNGSFVLGETTQENVRATLGSPNQIDDLNDGGEQWTYIKTEEVGLLTVTTDTGTNYMAEYTFDTDGILQDTAYRAEPLGNALTGF